MTQADLLAAGVAEMGLEVSAEAQQQLLAYLAMLQKWNKVYNLTAITNPLEMVTLHLLDSLSVLPYIAGKNLLDIGSGAGLPGIVLAIVKPELQVTCVDTVQKKAIFMRQVKAELGLQNLTVEHQRVENFKTAEKFEMVISRAFSEIGIFKALSMHLIAPKGVWLAMKGQIPTQELEGLAEKPSKIIKLSVAGLNAERHLVIFESSEQ